MPFYSVLSRALALDAIRAGGQSVKALPALFFCIAEFFGLGPDRRFTVTFLCCDEFFRKRRLLTNCGDDGKSFIVSFVDAWQRQHAVADIDNTGSID